MLSDYLVHPSLATADLTRARAWYADKLDLRPIHDWPGLLVYRVGGTIFTVFETPAAGTAKNTVAVWSVDHLAAEMARLRARGVLFEEYDFGGGDRTVDGVMADDDGNLNAWFSDSDDNIISLFEGHDEPGRPVGIVAMLAAADIGRAKAWYADKLGFVPRREFDGLLNYTSGPTRFSVYETPSAGTARNTVAVWRVDDLRAEVALLRSHGVVFEDVDLGDAQTTDGILTDDDGDMLAWFTDSEGNILGIAEDRSGPLT